MQLVAEPKAKLGKPILDTDQATRLNTEPVIPELIAPLLEEAKSILNRQFKKQPWQLQASAFDDLVGWYEQQLTRLTNSLILQRYSSFFLTRYPFWRPEESAPGDCQPGEDRHILDDYIEWEYSTGLLTSKGPYPELNRLIQLTKDNWIVAVVELFERIEQHAADIATLMNLETISLSDLSAATFGISDPHDNGRTAAILRFGSNKVVYKPRSLDGEYGWNFIVQYLESNGLDYDFFLPKIKKYEGYGFMEFVDTPPCQSKEEVQLCYERYGAIMGMAHAFGTYDLHHENIIVSGACPVVIDAEPLFRCIMEHSEQGENRLKLDKTISFEDLESKESVLDIGMLPQSVRSQLDEEDNKYKDYITGAFHPFALEPLKDHVPCGRGSNNLQFLETKVQASAFPNLPFLDGQVQLPQDYLTFIEKGFKKAHAFLLQKREVIIYKDLLYEQLKKLKLRLLVRPTMQYAIIFIRSISAELLRSKKTRRQKIVEDLRLLGQLRLDDINRIEAHEIENIMNGDIPRFEIWSDAKEAYDTQLMHTPIEWSQQRFERMDALDLELQTATITEKIVDRIQVVSDSPLKQINRIAQTEHAFEIVDSIVKTVRSENKDPFWVYTAYAPGYSTTMVHADREAMYDGAIGTAVAVAEAGRMAGNDHWLKVAKGVFDPVLRGETPESIFRSGGIARGLGGLIYSLLRVSDAAGDPALLHTAGQLALKHAREVLDREELDELLHGRSGLLLAMIALHRRSPKPEFESIIAEIAQSLIGRAVNHKGGICWPVMDGHSLPNASHGTSGIAMALARWYQLSGDPEAKRVLLGALDYDNSFWDSKEQGWVDARVANIPMEHATTWTWCNGRGGGLLSRLAVSEAVGLPFFDDYTKNAFQGGVTDILNETSPGLCCGTPGLVDVLLKINAHYPLPFVEEALEKAINLITLHSPKGHYCTLTAALFTGTAGLAFSLLRAGNPDKVKSLLWFE